MWQKCPICDGSGKTYNTISSSTYDICTTCNGKKIISEVKGLPPYYGETVNKGDYRDDNIESQQEYYGKK